jgi:hypothetical protein
MTFEFYITPSSSRYDSPTTPSAPSFYPQYSQQLSQQQPLPTEPPPSYSQPSGDFTNLSSLSLSQDAARPSQPGSSADLSAVESREIRYANILNQYEISSEFSNRLQTHLAMTKIVYVYDDSGSMNSVLSESPLNSGLFKATRWDELKNFSRVSIDLASIFNPEGIDIYFLNRPVARAVKHINDLEPYLIDKPSGFTPMRRILERVLVDNSKTKLGERKLLIVIVTDGEPTNDQGKQDIKGLKKVLQSRDKNVFTTIVSCTDEAHTMDYLNNWDRNIARLDVVDDYRNERSEIVKSKGKNFPFSYGDYIVKVLIGSIDQELDDLDENIYCGCTLI